MKILSDRWVLALLVLGLGLRVWGIGENLLLHYDQGRDLLVVRDIWRDHKLTLLGPAADTEMGGIFFGPLYYYLLAIPLWISGGSPVAAMVFLIMLEVVSWRLFFVGARSLFGRKVALVALGMGMVSYGLVSYSRWLSNAMPVLMLGNWLVYFGAELVKGKNLWIWWWLVMGLMFAFNPAAGVGLFVFGLGWMLRSKVSSKEWLKAILAFLIPSVPQILFEVRHDFLTTRSVIKLMAGVGGGINNGISAWSLTVEGVWGYGWRGIVTVLVLVVMWGLVRENRNRWWLAGGVLVQLGVLLLFKRTVYGHFFIATMPMMILLVTEIVIDEWKYWGWTVVLMLVVFNLYLDMRDLGKPSLMLTPIGTANMVTIGSRLKMVEFIKKTDEGRTYTLWSYTIPYYQEQVWRYLLWWKGVPMPVDKGELVYALAERDWDRPDRLVNWQINNDKETVVVERMVNGDLVVEKRNWR